MSAVYTAHMANVKVRKRREVKVVDETALAKRIGARLRAERLRSGLTQRELAGDRYTAQYVSSLERGAAKPSMASINYLAERLNIPVRDLWDQPAAPWKRVEADLKLAAGELQDAADLYRDLLDAGPAGGSRAELLRGLSEALCRQNRASEAIAPAAEAAELFERDGRAADAALATYWLASAQYQADNVPEARALLQGLLERVRAGLEVESGFRLRLLTSLAAVVSWSGDHQRALTYLEEGRGLADTLDPRAAAAYYYSLAVNYQHVGDLEAAVQAAHRSLGFYEGSNLRVEIAALHNHLALTHLRLGSTKRARAFARQASDEATQLGDERALAGIVETQAQIAFGEGHYDEALELSQRAIDLGEAATSPYAVLGGWLTRARSLAAQGKTEPALAAFGTAADLARQQGLPSRRREVLAEYGDFLSRTGRDKEALALYREAVKGD